MSGAWCDGAVVAGVCGGILVRGDGVCGGCSGVCVKCIDGFFWCDGGGAGVLGTCGWDCDGGGGIGKGLSVGLVGNFRGAHLKCRSAWGKVKLLVLGCFEGFCRGKRDRRDIAIPFQDVYKSSVLVISG